MLICGYIVLKVLDFGWPDTLAPPLERLCNICKSIESWLNSSSKNVVVLHCRLGLSRLGVVIAAYIDYCNVCTRCSIAILLLVLLLLKNYLAHQHKACRREYETKQCSNGCNDISFGCQCVLEGDRIPSLKSHGQALKQERCLPGLFCDTGDAPANYYYYYY